MKINLLQRAEIDKNKWNSCVHFANNGNVCGYMWYIDAITKDWEALVAEDYSTVFPLIWKKNWLGRKKIYQPELILVGGIYSQSMLSSARLKYFFEAIPKTYKSLKIAISGQAKIPKNIGLKVESNTRHFLFLNKPYEQLQQAFSSSFQLQLVKASENELQASSNLKPEIIVDFYKANAPNYVKENYFAYLRIMYNAIHRGWGFANGITNKKGDLIAASFFIFSHGKIMILLAINSKEGKEKGAMELLLTLLIQTHANKSIILDFNRFEIEGLGNQTQAYHIISR